MENAHLRLGLLEYVRMTEKTSILATLSVLCQSSSSAKFRSTSAKQRR